VSLVNHGRRHVANQLANFIEDVRVEKQVKTGFPVPLCLQRLRGFAEQAMLLMQRQLGRLSTLQKGTEKRMKVSWREVRLTMQSRSLPKHDSSPCLATPHNPRLFPLHSPRKIAGPHARRDPLRR
jgi:hypothetical protein